MESAAAKEVIKAEDVLESLMNDGTMDAMRLKIIKQLKGMEELEKTTISMVEHSKVLNTPGAEKQTKRQLFDALRNELEAPALERASKLVWELIMDNDGFGKEITQNVESVFCRLSGREPPLFPPSVSEPEQSKENESSGKEKEGEQIEEDEDAKQSSHPPSTPIDSVPDPRKVTADCGKSFEVEPMRCARTDGKNWQCSKNCVVGARYCERHLPQSKRPKISARHCERHLPKHKKPKKSAETNKLGTSSNNVVDGISNILGSASSQFVTRKTDDNHKNSRKKHKGSPREEASEEAVPLVRLLRLRSVSKTDTGD